MPCTNHHKWMRYEASCNGRMLPRPVKLRATLSTDFCLHCRIFRKQLESGDL